MGMEGKQPKRYGHTLWRDSNHAVVRAGSAALSTGVSREQGHALPWAEARGCWYQTHTVPRGILGV
jgi:hypothetical protein